MGTTTIRSSTQAIAVELPGRVTYAQAERIRQLLDEAAANPGRPIILEQGARLRSLDGAGRVTPNDPVTVTLPAWALIIGALAGSFGTLVIVLLVGLLA